MSMTGGISFYDKSKCLQKDGASCVASSATALQNLILNSNKYFKWTSSGSNDATTETLTITLPTAVSISRMFLIGHNFKSFDVRYDNGSPADFANVRGLDSLTDNEIDVSNISRNTSYFEFTPVTTDTLIIRAFTTQTTNAEKFLAQFIVTNELGTFEGYPQLNDIELSRSIQKEQAISGRFHIQKGYESAAFDLNLRTYPKQNDIDLLQDLHEREDPFLVWPCGGLPDQFRIKQRGFLVDDIFQMQLDQGLRNSYDKNVYLMGVNQRYSFVEVV